METTLPQQNPSFVRRTFAAIATRYDLANHLLSGGCDFLWRAKAARMIAARKPTHVLDLATGSGDLARALGKASPRSVIIGADFCLPMLEIARKKNIPLLVQADGLRLPFRDAMFDAVTVAFGLRNMASWDAALQEMARVLRPEGVILVMDFSLPDARPLRNLYRLYLHNVLPRLASVITGNREAYEYLGSSIESFPRGRAMEDLVKSCGFADFRAQPLCFGVASIYTARRAL
ncbi:MAG TPA: ubiquinone/menaquinone biosynthesis methyltransferase [Terrimicrobiaceae bacterium]|nr:ubiquinone/menaquinone biosynthesis methyltransferase [Terrimicrobiaceae bacterium]